MGLRRSTVGGKGAPPGRSGVKRRHAEVTWPETPSSKVGQSKRSLILAIGTAAAEVAREHLAASEFHAILREAVDAKILSVERVAEIGRVDRTTASRWINNHTTPNAVVQEVILVQIDSEAARLAATMGRSFDR